MKERVFKIKQWLEITQYLEKRLISLTEVERLNNLDSNIINIYGFSTDKLLSTVKNTNSKIGILRMKYFNTTGKEYKESQ